MSTDTTTEAVEPVDAPEAEAASPQEEASSRKGKPRKAKHDPNLLDESRAYGTVHGRGKIRYWQDGKYFGIDKRVLKEQPEE